MLFNRSGYFRGGLMLLSALAATQLFGAAPVQAQENHKPKKGAVTIPVFLLALTVKTDHPTYPADSAVKFTLTAKNTTHQDMALGFRSGQRYDFELFRSNSAKGEKIWQWSKGRMFADMLSSTTLKPGKSLAFTETYRSGGDGMPALAPGVYTVGATLKSVSKSVPSTPLPSAYTTFHVK